MPTSCIQHAHANIMLQQSARAQTAHEMHETSMPKCPRVGHFLPSPHPQAQDSILQALVLLYRGAAGGVLLVTGPRCPLYWSHHSRIREFGQLIPVPCIGAICQEMGRYQIQGRQGACPAYIRECLDLAVPGIGPAGIGHAGSQYVYRIRPGCHWLAVGHATGPCSQYTVTAGG